MTDCSRRLRRSPVHLLHQAEQAAGRLFAESALGFVTLRQLVVLVAVSERDGLNQTELVERTGIDRSTLAEIIPRLVRKGLVQRRRSREDTRAKVLRLTDEGGGCWMRPNRWRRTWTGSCSPSCPRRSATRSWPRCRRSLGIWKRSVNPARATLVPLPRALGGCLLGSHATWPRPSPTGAPFGVA
jgi:DNA-binding MarR family transcriptional regulator